jgi:hypothetical protein
VPSWLVTNPLTADVVTPCASANSGMSVQSARSVSREATARRYRCVWEDEEGERCSGIPVSPVEREAP